MRPGKRRLLPDAPEDRLDNLVETAKAHIRGNGEYPSRVIKQQFDFQKTPLRGMLKNRCKVNVLAALSNLSWHFAGCYAVHDWMMNALLRAIIAKHVQDLAFTKPRSGG